MPYLVQRKDPIETLATYPDRASAHKHAKFESAIVVFEISDDERRSWYDREHTRFDDGTYQRTPWHQTDQHPEHFAHMSIKQPGLIAYTETPEKGIADRQTTIRPGRYLEQFYPDIPKAIRDRHCGACSADFQMLHVTIDPSEIEAIYTAKDAPQSCMSHGLDDYSGHCHPVRVYGGQYSDLALAYCGDLDQGVIKARAIVWPDKKRYGRLYGHESLLVALLQADGWSSGSMKGARIAAISDDNGSGWIMPYVDEIPTARLTSDRKSFILGEGSTVTTETCGVTNKQPDYDFTCDMCNGRFTDDDYAGDGLCNDCDDHMITCESCANRYYDQREDFTETRDGQLCASCAEDATVTCVIKDCGNTWIETAEFTVGESRDRDNRCMAELCRSCADGCDHCANCDNYTDRGSLTCEECGSTDIEHGRCEHTNELPLSENTSSDQPSTSVSTEVASCESPF